MRQQRLTNSFGQSEGRKVPELYPPENPYRKRKYKQTTGARTHAPASSGSRFSVSSATTHTCTHSEAHSRALFAYPEMWTSKRWSQLSWVKIDHAFETHTGNPVAEVAVVDSQRFAAVVVVERVGNTRSGRTAGRQRRWASRCRPVEVFLEMEEHRKTTGMQVLPGRSSWCQDDDVGDDDDYYYRFGRQGIGWDLEYFPSAETPTRTVDPSSLSFWQKAINSNNTRINAQMSIYYEWVKSTMAFDDFGLRNHWWYLY